ncbi:hypothetical protein [Daejeonella sp.]|uniref:hypothetical protein n=1 Tax=Daejeonella sp. TaxID=2805397 RepID=UPI0025C062E5|nr:hypothetical protein [Daejeonella sp.]
MLNQLKTYPTVWLFIFYCLYLSCINYFVQTFLFTENVIYNSYAEQLSFDRIEEIIDEQNKYSWLGYLIIPLLQAIKFFLVACCLAAGALFFDLKLKFGQAFKVALLADVVFIVPMLIKIFWFMVIKQDYTLQDLQMFSPLSVLNLMDTKNIGVLWLYPLQLLNVFELVYILLLGFWVYQFVAKSFEKGLNMVLSSYLPALFIWIVLVMFVTLNLNPQA